MLHISIYERSNMNHILGATESLHKCFMGTRLLTIKWCILGDRQVIETGTILTT